MRIVNKFGLFDIRHEFMALHEHNQNLSHYPSSPRHHSIVTHSISFNGVMTPAPNPTMPLDAVSQWQSVTEARASGVVKVIDR